MPQRFNRDIEDKLLDKFEFVESTNREDSHRWLELKLAGLPTIRTFFSDGNQHVGPDLWKKIAHQLKVRPNYLDGMIDCTNDKDAYYEKVRNDPYPPWPAYVLKRLR